MAFFGDCLRFLTKKSTNLTLSSRRFLVKFDYFIEIHFITGSAKVFASRKFPWMVSGDCWQGLWCLMGFYHHQMNHVLKLNDALKKHIDIDFVCKWNVSHSDSGGGKLQFSNTHTQTPRASRHKKLPSVLMVYVIVNRLLCSSLSPKCFWVWWLSLPTYYRLTHQHVDMELNRWWGAPVSKFSHRMQWVLSWFLLISWPILCAFRTSQQSFRGWRAPFLQKLQVVSLKSGASWCGRTPETAVTMESWWILLGAIKNWRRFSTRSNETPWTVIVKMMNNPWNIQKCFADKAKNLPSILFQ